jgi:hypothetical protein
MTARNKTSWRQNLALVAALVLLTGLFVVIRWWLFLLIPTLLIVALLIVGLVSGRRRSRALHRFRTEHTMAGQDLLLVYSTSPNWSEYIETNWIQRWGPRAVVVNVSQRPTWKREATSEAQLFRSFVPRGTFHPAAVHVPVQGSEQLFWFREAFRDYKHGNSASLRTLESQLAAALEGARASDASYEASFVKSSRKSE